MNKKIIFYTVLLSSSSVIADYKDDVGYSQLQTQLGANTPNGTGVAVTQVEFASGETETEIGAWLPDTAAAQFSGKSIVDQSVPVSNGISNHSTGVGGLFYGNNAMASGIVNVDVYSASDWLLDGFLKTGNFAQPIISDSRVANHSWVGFMEADSDTIKALKRVDWLVEENEFIQVSGMNNRSNNQPLLGSTYNSITVGRTDADHSQGSVALDSSYGAGRTRPDVVAPKNTTSSATPIVSAAVVMLIEQAHTAALGTSTTISNGDSIYNGERSEVVKAIIMAGADRVTENTSTTTQIIDYRVAQDNQTSNGLDKRYGAGQLNVYNNYQIMAAGEQDSLEDGGTATVALMGYDYDASFGGENSNDSASYQLDMVDAERMQLTASLAWNIDIEDTNGFGFNPDATLYDLDLFLYDVTEGSNSLLASSISDIDNTENLWFFLEQGHDYKLLVSTADGALFNWDYGLAWKVSAIPLPATAWLFITGLFGLSGLRPVSTKQPPAKRRVG